MTGHPPIRVLLAEDQGLVLGALSALLRLESDLDIVGCAANGLEALRLLESKPADIVVTDIEMPEMSGLELARVIRERHSGTRVMVVTTFARSGYLKRAMDAGVRGYLLKDSPASELADAVRRVYRGETLVAPELLTEAWTSVDPLSERERQVLKLAAEGQTSDAIAASLHLSPGTVRNYLSEASSKLGASNRIEAARIARQNGWL